MIEPKPCPFCGSTDLKFTSKESYLWAKGENGNACISISCRKCDACKYDFDDRLIDYESKKEHLIESWNKRVENMGV